MLAALARQISLRSVRATCGSPVNARCVRSAHARCTRCVKSRCARPFSVRLVNARFVNARCAGPIITHCARLVRPAVIQSMVAALGKCDLRSPSQCSIHSPSQHSLRSPRQYFASHMLHCNDLQRLMSKCDTQIHKHTVEKGTAAFNANAVKCGKTPRLQRAIIPLRSC